MPAEILEGRAVGVIRRQVLGAGLATVGSLTLGGMGAQAQKMQPVTYGPQRRTIQHGMAKTTKLFKSPPGFANALAVAPEGLWIGQQKLSGSAARDYHLPDPPDLHEAAWLVDWNG